MAPSFLPISSAFRGSGHCVPPDTMVASGTDARASSRHTHGDDGTCAIRAPTIYCTLPRHPPPNHGPSSTEASLAQGNVHQCNLRQCMFMGMAFYGRAHALRLLQGTAADVARGGQGE